MSNVTETEKMEISILTGTLELGSECYHIVTKGCRPEHVEHTVGVIYNEITQSAFGASDYVQTINNQDLRKWNRERYTITIQIESQMI